MTLSRLCRLSWVLKSLGGVQKPTRDWTEKKIMAEGMKAQIELSYRSFSRHSGPPGIAEVKEMAMCNEFAPKPDLKSVKSG